MIRAVLTLLLVLAAALPARAQSAAELQAIVAARVGAAAGEGLFAVERFRAMGGAVDAESGGRVAYFSARVRLTRDHDFGAWQGETLQSLALALGAGPRGIRGAKPGGNRAGDVLGANGAIRLKREGDAWVPLAAGPTPGAPISLDGPGGKALRLLAAIETALTGGPRAAGGAAAPVIEQELAIAWRHIEGRLTRMERGYPLAGGAPGTEYARLAAAIAGASRPVAAGGPMIIALPSAGSVETLRLLAEGTAALGLAQADVAALAQQGRGARGVELPALPGLRALAALYPEVVHVIVPAASPVRRMADLAGRPLGVGVAGSGARATAEIVLAAHGLDGPRIALMPEEAAAALASGRIAAWIWVTLAPAQAVQRLADAAPFRLLPLDPAAMPAEGALLRPATIPAHTYPGQAEAVPTLGTVALLLGTEGLRPDEVDALLGLLLGAPGVAGQGGPAALQISRARARETGPVPLHPAAAAFHQRGVR